MLDNFFFMAWCSFHRSLEDSKVADNIAGCSKADDIEIEQHFHMVLRV